MYEFVVDKPQSDVLNLTRTPINKKNETRRNPAEKGYSLTHQDFALSRWLIYRHHLPLGEAGRGITSL